MTVVTIEKTNLDVVTNKLAFDSEVMKQVKNMVKSIKKDRRVNVLNHAKFSTKNGVLTVMAAYNNLDENFILQKDFDVDCETDLSFLVPFDTIRKVTRIRKDETFTITAVNDSTLEFQRGSIKQVFNTMATQDFPKLPAMTFEHIGNVTYEEILNLNSALLSVLKNNIRPILKSVLIRNRKIASTDAHRLFQTKSQIDYEEDLKITAAGIKKLKDIFNKDNAIEVYINENNFIKFKTENTSAVISLLNGNYPELHRLVPDHFNTTLTVHNTREFMKVVKDATDIAKKVKNNLIKLEITKHELKITANDPNVGSYESSVNIDMEGEDLELYVNGNYVLDGIKQVDSNNSLEFNFVGAMRPFIVTSYNSSDTLSLILPIRSY